MVLLFGVLALSLIVGFLVGGRLAGLARNQLRLWWLAPIGLALQLAPGGEAISFALMMVSYIALAAFAVANLRTAGFTLITLGVALNWLVIGLNGGMPVSADALRSSGQGASLRLLTEEGGAKHHLATDDRLEFLGDVIPVGGPIEQVVSVGDILVYAGMAWFVVASMKRPAEDPPGLANEPTG